MPTVITRGSVSAQAYGFGATKAGLPYFFMYLSDGTTGSMPLSAKFRSDGSFGLFFNHTNVNRQAVANFSAAGVYSSGVLFGSYGGAGSKCDITSGGSFVGGGNEYSFIYTANNTFTYNRVAQSVYGYIGDNPAFSVYDNTNSVAYRGFYQSDYTTSYGKAHIVKLNSSGVIQWLRYWNTGANQSQIRGTALGGSNLYIAYTYGTNLFIASVNTSTGNSIFYMQIIGVSDASRACIYADSSGNLYVFCSDTRDLLKIDSGGNLLWANRLSASGLTSDAQCSMCFSSTGAHLLVSTGFNTYGNAIIKINPSTGAVVSAVSFNMSGVSGGISTAIEARSGRIFCGGKGRGYVYVIPEDFTKLGTYTVNGVAITYASLTVTASSSTFTVSIVSDSYGSSSTDEFANSSSALTAPTVLRTSL